jgi:hypothetical protein
MRFRRDVGRIQDALVHAGQAAWLTGDSEFTARAAVATDSGAELVRSAAAVRQLLPPR